jgi:hypothetical protein
MALLAPTIALADPTLIQVVPFGGFRAGGDLQERSTGARRDIEESGTLGIALELRVDREDRWVQLWYSRQDSQVRSPGAALDLDVEYLHIGGTAPIREAGRVRSYVAGGLGVTRLAPRDAGLEDAVEFSGSVGLGVSIPVSERLAFRLEARAYLTLVDPETSIFCASGASGGSCLIQASGSTLFQAEISAGIAFAF